MSGHLRRQLGPVKARLRNKLATYGSLLDPDCSPTALDLDTAKHSLISLKDSYLRIISAWEDVLTKCSSIEEQEQEARLFEEAVPSDLLLDTEEQIAHISASLRQAERQRQPPAQQVTAPSKPSPTCGPVSLPKLKIPIFFW